MTMEETDALWKSKEDCKENGIHNRRRKLKNKNKQGDKGHIKRGIIRFTKSLLLSWYGDVERMPK